MHHTRRGIRNYLYLIVGYPERTYTIFTEHHRIIHSIRHIDFCIGTGHAIILITDNQCIPVTIDGPYRNIFHQLTLESQREIFGNRPAGNNVSAQIHGTCRSEAFTHFHLISLVDGRRTGRFRNCQYHGYGVSVKAFVHKKAVIQRSHISRCNAVDCHFGAVGRINILR